MARIMIDKLPIVFGIALVENAYDETCIVEVLPAEQIEEREVVLLEAAKRGCRKYCSIRLTFL